MLHALMNPTHKASLTYIVIDALQAFITYIGDWGFMTLITLNLIVYTSMNK